MYKLYFFFIIILILHSSCNNSISFNPVKMSLDINEITVTEGEKAVFSFSLNDKVSHEFFIKGTFSSEEFNFNYANINDFSTSLEYSLDDGESWNTEGDGSLVKVAPSDSFTYMIRFSTIDDNNHEIALEKINLKLELASTDRKYLTSTLPNITVSIQDNDTDKDYRSNLDFYSYLMGFEKSDNGEFFLRGVTNSVTTKKEKEIIDGDYMDILTMINRIIKTSPKFSSITRISFDYNPLSTKLASVEGFIGIFNSWTMYINLSRAYINFSTGQRQTFNQDGGIASTLIHELGHILTLDDTQRTIQSKKDCTLNSLRVAKNICFFQNSYIASFVNDYYDATESEDPSSKTNLKQPSFINLYSTTNLFEDIAESFAGYVYKSNIPPYSGNGEYLKKLGFFEPYSELKNIKRDIKNLGYVIDTPGRGYNTSNGGFSSNIFQNCTHDDRLIQFEKKNLNLE